MIHEVVEVKEYLHGKNINVKNLYRICFLMAKWHKQQGLPHLQIRNAIFDWGKQHDIYIKYDLNKIIYAALDDKTKLKEHLSVKINNRDINEIKNRFDSKNSRLVALAILCYAKAFADQNQSFSISSTALATWIGVHSTNLSSRHLKELIDFGYITKLSTPKNTYKWENKNPSSKYKINVELHNSGHFTLIENKILDLYSEVFCPLEMSTRNTYQQK